MAPTNLSSLTYLSTTASLPDPLFGLQDAMNVKFETSDKYTSLFPDACKQPGNSHNCTTSCLSNRQMFASLDTLHNCVVWPSIYVEDEETQLVPYAVGLAKSLGLEKGDKKSTLPSKISNSIQNCLLDSCEVTAECALKANAAFPGEGFRKHFTAKVTDNLYYGTAKLPDYFNPCEYISGSATPDVAGVGVRYRRFEGQKVRSPSQGFHLVRDANGSCTDCFRPRYSLEKGSPQDPRRYNLNMAHDETRGPDF